MKGFITTSRGSLEYRRVGQGEMVMVLHGSHMNCDVALGEQFFLQRGYQLFIPSRPGYGQTPLATGSTAEQFAMVLAEVLQQWGIERVIVLGISAGGRTALQFASHYPVQTKQLILQSAITHPHWPEHFTKVSSYIVFQRWLERYTWALTRFLLRERPQKTTQAILRQLTTLDPAAVYYHCTPEQREQYIQLFCQLRSGAGFLADINHQPGDVRRITAPTLVVHSKFDGAVNLSHPHWVTDRIPQAQVYVSEAESHLIWFSSHYTAIEVAMDTFLGYTTP